MKRLLLFAFLTLSMVLNAQTITSVTPNTANAGETLQVTITGNNTDFSSISSAYNISFYSSIGQTYFNPFAMDVVSDTEVNVMLTVPNWVPTGSYSATVDYMFNSVTLPNAFFITNNNNTITGNITVDSNGNGCDASDLHMGGIKVTLNDGTSDSYTFTNHLGNYIFHVGSGNFTITPEPDLPYFASSPLSTTVNFATAANLNQVADFCLAPSGVHNDLFISILTMMPARPGFDASYRLVYKNEGNQTMSGNVNFNFDDSRLDFISASVTPTSQTAGNLSWDFSNLLPFESRTIDLTLNVNSPMETPAVNINDILPFVITVNPIADDETPGNNTFSLNQVVVGSYDPNDKAVAEGAQLPIENVGDYLHYLIRFQNSGNFMAENVRVQDMLADNLDASTLQVVSASHPYRTTLTEGNRLQFFFDNINLPPEDQDEPGSHGFVSFKIKPATTVGIGSVMQNTAEIYFDFNFPIITNTVATTVTVLGIPETGLENGIVLYPNPIVGIANVRATESISRLAVTNMSGQLLFESQPNATDCTIDLSAFPKGVYFVTAESGRKLRHLKVVKE